MKRRVFLLIAMLLLMTNTVYASEPAGTFALGKYRSVLLSPGITQSKDTAYAPFRGEYISTGMLQISDMGNGSVYICVDTLAHVNVDRISHTVFLDRWDDRREDWVQIHSWEFERTKEEEGGELSMVTDTITVKNVEPNMYYRARAFHMVELDGETEGYSTETDGVLITKD